MPTLILRPWLSPTRLSLVPKAAREGLANRSNQAAYNLILELRNS
jgi:hypothetical protein